MKKARKQTASVKRDEAAMTWEEIGLALGYKDDPRYGAKVAFMFYYQAMKKIRKRPLAMPSRTSTSWRRYCAIGRRR